MTLHKGYESIRHSNNSSIDSNFEDSNPYAGVEYRDVKLQRIKKFSQYLTRNSNKFIQTYKKNDN